MTNVESFTQWHAAVAEESEKQLADVAGVMARDPAMRRLVGVGAVSDTAADEAVALLARAEWAFTTRRVDRSRAAMIVSGGCTPAAGDLVLARIDRLGHHGNLQLVDGRRRRLFPGDYVVVAYGNRYACEQFEAHVPDTLGPCHLVAGGGIASRALSWHDRIARGPTHMTPVGLLADEQGARLNLADFALEATLPRRNQRPDVIAVMGTAMDAGKTETAAFLVRGLREAGRRVGYIKVTGTGAGGDTWLLRDAGADRVLDFTDAGLPSTYLTPLETITGAMEMLVDHMGHDGMDVVVMEVADGVYQRETSGLLLSETFASTVDGIVLAARDAMGASAGVASLARQSRPVVALSGLLSASPLQRREAFDATGIDSLNREELATRDTAGRLLAACSRVSDLKEVC